MRNLSHDPLDARRWADKRGACPAVTDEGDLTLALPDIEQAVGEPMTWEEFAGVFTAEDLCFVWDDIPGSDFFALGPEYRVRHLAEEVTPAEPPPA